MRNKFIIFLSVLLFCFCWAPLAYAQELTINVIAVNGALEAKEMDVKYYLPKELEPEDILDPGGLEVDYDVDKVSYFVHGTMSFEPKESRTFKIKVKDVWVIQPEEIGVLKEQLDGNLDLLKKKESYDVARRARDQIFAQLDFILAQQSAYSEDIGMRVEQCRAYMNLLNDIRNKVYSLDYLEYESKGLDEIDPTKTVKFVIEVENPYDEEKTVKHKHYLPEEIREEDVFDKKSFSVRFDEKKELAYLSQEEVFQPKEIKKYDVVIKDVWQFPLSKVDALEGQASSAMEELEDSIYSNSGRFLFDKIVEEIQQIKDSQVEQDSIKKHIGIYRVNEKRYEELKKYVARLVQMLAIVRQKKLEELESSSVKNVLSRLKALRGLAALSEALFKKGISITMTWRIIGATMTFVALFTALHFFIWSKRSKVMGEEKGPAEGEGIKEVPKPGEEEKEEEAVA